MLEETGIDLVQGEKARLIPVGSERSQERRATSAFLSTLSIVDEYAAAILGSLNVKIGSRSSLNCFTEVVLADEEGSKDRPDGLVVLKKGKTSWSALVEAKTGNAQLEPEQIQRYLTLAKKHKLDAVITISNQFAALPSHHPIKISKSLTRSVDLFHWSWTFLQTQAIFELEIEQQLDPEQRYILSEFSRFLDHPSTGVKSFDSMNSEWKEVCHAVKNGGRLLKTSEAVQNTIGSWHQEQRDVSLMLTRKLKTPVSQKLKKKHESDPSTRLKDDSSDFVEKQKLEATFKIPDAASDLIVTADLTRRTVSVGMELATPSDKKSTKARANWLLRQLQKSDSKLIHIVAVWPGRIRDTIVTLEALRKDPDCIQCENPGLVPVKFRPMLVCDMAGKFSGAKTFLEGMNNSVLEFYEDVGEHLRVWVPPAPKLPKQEEPEDVSTREF
ncbi:MAG: hypothetical protein JJ850_05200 [Kordiimonadaceae bacterium]|nr:hypothetical protein [Kordiimonadaceae bacterium]MBO6568282.1 hypothetical protein [Kordiimonadaceae bacterium]MBO6963988.1 hypothetical protein [Kordiimonadaceae bacterium]